MRLAPASRVRAASGWLWLEPRPVSLRIRQAILAAALAALATVTAAAPDLLRPPVALAVVVAALGTACLALYRAWRVSVGRVGASRIGVTVHSGASSATFGWEAVTEVRVRERGRSRASVELGLDDRTVTVRETFGARAARQWASQAAGLAPARVGWGI